jgi:hypothetical protein
VKVLLVGAALLMGCADHAVVQPAIQPERDMLAINQVHNADATRSWFVLRDAWGNDHIVYCDAAFLVHPNASLCVPWPPRAVPAGPGVSAPAPAPEAR